MEATQQAKQPSHAEICERINQRIIEALENGTVPWRKPWSSAGVPKNIYSGKEYHGVNRMLLALLDYDQNLFITFKQLKEIGGKVKRGEHGHLVCYWASQKPKENAGTETDQTQKGKRFLRQYYVFNVSQCENVPNSYLPAERALTDLPACAGVVKSMPHCPKIVHEQNYAFYDVAQDYINMPKRKRITSDAAYYSTLFHELVHSTGHKSRLNRDGVENMTKFGDELYSFEELVAEIGTCYLLWHTGIAEQFDQSVAYIQGWLSVLRNDKWFIFSASRDAQKAMGYILGLSTDDTDEK